MSEPTPASPAAETPHWQTGVLWGLLALFLTIGTLAAAFFVYALTVWILPGNYWVGVPVAAIAAFVSFLCYLFMAGILYRVDRYRGANQRVVKLFE